MVGQARGLTFGEFCLGDRFISEERMITEEDIISFAELSGDFNPLHLDEEYARKSPYGERIAHGLLGLAAVSGLAAKLGFAEETILAFRGLEWKYKQPIKIGDTIKAEFKVVEKRSLANDNAGLVIFRVKVINQQGQKVQIGKWSTIIKNN